MTRVMRAIFAVLVVGIFAGLAAAAYAASETITMNAIDANGVGKDIGTLVLSDTQAGLQITPQLVGLPPGDHGFHAHVNPNCGPGPGPNGQPAAGMAAGGHYDPANTGKHLGPLGEGHKGDMPVLIVDASGKATKAVVVPHLTVADVKGRSIMIHAGGDNYSDQPAPLGGGGARIACGVAK
jgi:superoxide dismutase, Cu-Zn family